jgi:hypothetical protein
MPCVCLSVCLSVASKTQASLRHCVQLTKRCVEYSCNVFNYPAVDWVLNVMAHAQKPDLVYRWNGRVYLNRRGLQFSLLLAAEVCASAVVMLDTPCFEVVWRLLATHSIRQFPLHFPSRASPCAITFQLHSTAVLLGIISVSCNVFYLRTRI